MPDSTILEDVVVFGNRRLPGGSFGGGSNGGGPPGPRDGRVIRPRTVSPDEPEPPYVYDPCDSETKKREKSIDAAAAAAVSYFESLAQAANENGFEVRERGAYLFYDPLTGETTLGPVSTGEPFVNGGVGSTGALSFGGNNPARLVGSIHTHSVGNALPSTGPNGGGDRGHFTSMQASVTAAQGDSTYVRIYVAAANLVGANETQYNKITVYNQTNLDSAIESGTPGPEVDRNGQSCPPA